MPQILGMMQMAFESEEPPIPHVHRGGPRPSYETHPMAPGNLAAAAMLAHGQMGEEDDMADTGAQSAFCGCTAVETSQLCTCKVSVSLLRRRMVAIADAPLCLLLYLHRSQDCLCHQLP